MVFKKDDCMFVPHDCNLDLSDSARKLWETLHARSQNLANWTSQAMVPLSKSKWRPFFIELPNSLMHYQISKLSHLGAIILDGTKKGIDLATLQAREGKLHSSRDSFGKQHKINAQYRCISEKRTLCCSG